ncbi:MAG TPA: flagellar basal body P-ring formation chaperone FlgA [Pirellulaceae bacterium]|nr:flagellar basal body P-ring formation chaperone FlgA [Pirellulaceae bacterium]
MWFAIIPHRFRLLPVALCVGLAALVLLDSATWGQIVEIRLRASQLMTSQQTVRIADVAELTGGPSSLRQKIGALDLDEFNENHHRLEITSERIRFRIRLAGIDDGHFSVVPGERIQVGFGTPLTANRVIELALCRQVADAYNIPESSVEVQLVSSLDTMVERAGLDLGSMRISVHLPAELPIGQRSMELLASDSSGLTVSLPATLKFIVFRDLVMAKENVSRGELLDDSKIERVRRPIDNPQVRFASYEQVIGSVAQSDIQQFSLLKSHTIKPAEQAASNVEIRRNMPMNIVVRQGGVMVTMRNARARQNGRVGDTIEFINPNTQRIIRAKIVDSTTAIIEM